MFRYTLALKHTHIYEEYIVHEEHARHSHLTAGSLL